MASKPCAAAPVVSRLRATLLACVIAVAVIAASAGSAHAVSTATGGEVLAIPPKVKQVKCVRACAKRRAVRAGSVIRMKGEDLETVSQVVFEGSRGSEDDVAAAPITQRSTALTVRVPANAASGPVVAVTAKGARSKFSVPLSILPQPPVIGDPELRPVPGYGAGLTLETGTSTPRVVFLGANEMVRFSARVGGADGVVANIAVVRQDTGAPAATWSIPAPAGQVVSVVWDGKSGGQPVGTGRYAFTISLSGSQGAIARSASDAADPNRDAFDVYGFMFPVRGKHNYGQAQARFGAGRPGHRHQGQDVMAACGTRLVAARGGVVTQSRYHGAAGNFIVIRTDGGVDQVYMHMVERSPFRPGDQVFTGQAIGRVGNTGRSSACHLHFEQWSAPGWYEGGKPFDPLPDLLAWDAIS